MFKIPVSAMIVLLPMATQAVTVSLGSTSAPLAEFTGEAANDGAGVSVHSAGDVNNDGYDDFLVGAYTNEDVGSDAGAAYLIYGRSTNLSSAGLNTVVQFSAEAAGDVAGYSVSSAGDVNNDGYDDLLIGADGNDDTASGAGAAYLIYGQATALTSSSLSTAVQFSGEGSAQRAGISVSSAGDVNNDGYDDLLIGAYRNGDAASGAGAAYLIYGQATALTSSSLSTAVQFSGEAANDNAGVAVSAAGDVNNDGYDDVLIGADFNDDAANNSGAVYLIYGQATTLTSSSLSTAIEFTGEAAHEAVGKSITAAGDVNNDGFGDLLIGASGNDAVATNAGAAYLIYGQSTALTSASLSTAVKFTGEAADDATGEAVSSAGDVNNDGFSDLLIGAFHNDDVASDSGAAYLLFGQATTLTTSSLSTALELTGEASNNEAGTAVGSAGDVNNDGYDDVLVGAYDNDFSGSIIGAAYLLYAQPSTISISSNTSSTNTIECGVATFSDPGATATDQYTNTSLIVSTADTISSTPAGTDSLTYSTANNTLQIASSSTRTVTITDTTVPVLSLVGDATLTIQQDDIYTDDGATVSDVCDTDLTVITTGSVDTSVPGEYTLSYNAVDNSSNTASSISRVVTVAPHGDIISATKDGKRIALVYEDDYEESMTPFAGNAQFVFAVSTDQLHIVATNGKRLRVFYDGDQVAQKKINRKKLRSKFMELKVKQLYPSKKYDDVMIVLAKKSTGKIIHLRLTGEEKLKKLDHKQVAITDRRPITMRTYSSTHRFTTRIGNKATTVSHKWQVTKQGALRLVE